jgi:signal transduction histidine kinase
MDVVTAPAHAPRRAVRRDKAGGILGGVCAGLGRSLGIDPLIFRVAFVVAATAGGAGVIAYVIAWFAIPREDAGTRRTIALRGGQAQVAAGVAMLVLATLLLFREWGLWVGDAWVWPLVLVATGAALIWRESAGAFVARRVRGAGSLAALGAALVVGGGLVFLWLNDALAPTRDVVLGLVVVLVAGGLILAPWWLRLVRGLSAEREARIRTQERADVAAHLHDSVLQTLALMQKRANDPRAVSTLARRQERELRAWLNGARAPGAGDTLVAALERAAAEVEDAHGVAVEVVTVGDRPLDEGAQAVAAAAREALVNAAKFAPDAPIRLFAESDGEKLSVFVRDRGPGFDMAAVPPDRRGVRESILGRMERHGGRAIVTSEPGEGTEVELTI